MAITLLGPLGSRSWGRRSDIGGGVFVWGAFFWLPGVLVAFHFDIQTVVMAHRLSCSAACGILVPQPGIEAEVPALQRRILNYGTIRSPLVYVLMVVMETVVCACANMC